MKATHRDVSAVCRGDLGASLVFRDKVANIGAPFETPCYRFVRTTKTRRACRMSHRRACWGYKCTIGMLASCYSRPLHKVAREYIYRQPTRKYAFLRKLVVTELTRKSRTFTHYNSQVQYRSQKEPAPIYTLSQFNPAHIHTHHLMLHSYSLLRVLTCLAS